MEMDLKARAAEVFKNYPNYDTLYATTDGTIFLDRIHAETHAESTETDIIEIKVNDAEKETKIKTKKNS